MDYLGHRDHLDHLVNQGFLRHPDIRMPLMYMALGLETLTVTQKSSEVHLGPPVHQAHQGPQVPQLPHLKAFCLGRLAFQGRLALQVMMDLLAHKALKGQRETRDYQDFLVKRVTLVYLVQMAYLVQWDPRALQALRVPLAHQAPPDP